MMEKIEGELEDELYRISNIDDNLFSYELIEIILKYRRRIEEITGNKEYAEWFVCQKIKEILDYDYCHPKKEKIFSYRGVGCSGDYPEDENDFFTPMTWNPEEYEEISTD